MATDAGEENLARIRATTTEPRTLQDARMATAMVQSSSCNHNNSVSEAASPLKSKSTFQVWALNTQMRKGCFKVHCCGALAVSQLWSIPNMRFGALVKGRGSLCMLCVSVGPGT